MQTVYLTAYRKVFQLTRLMRGVTVHLLDVPYRILISTHTPHARRDRRVRRGVSAEAISTHTPHARRDKCPECWNQEMKNFNSHASCEA